jgi:hypothetical protein
MHQVGHATHPGWQHCIMFLSNSSRQLAKSLCQSSYSARVVASSAPQWSAFHSSTRTSSEKPQADGASEYTKRMAALMLEIPDALKVPLSTGSSGSSSRESALWQHVQPCQTDVTRSLASLHKQLTTFITSDPDLNLNSSRTPAPN